MKNTLFLRDLPLLFMWLLIASLTPVKAEPIPKLLDQQSIRAILSQLNLGGYVIYMRHAATNHEQEDLRPVNLADCSSQRNLSQSGQQQAKNVGRIFKNTRIPLHQVFSSPFCRCKETAQLAFGRFQADESLHFVMGLHKNERREKALALKQRLLTPPPPGSNNVIVAHTANLQEAVGIWPKPEGVMYIFKPDRNGGFSDIYVVKPETWSQLNL